MQELLKDIAVNFLSDALWALGGLWGAKFLLPFFKKNLLVSFSNTNFFKKLFHVPYSDMLNKKSPFQLSPYNMV